MAGWVIGAILSRAFRPAVRSARALPVESLITMKIRNSLKSAKLRDKDCRVVRRRGRVYIINKKNPRMKARQG